MRAVLLLFGLLAPRFATAQSCALPPDLYRERVHLVERYSKEVGNDYLLNKAAYDDIVRKRRAIDQKYFEYMGRVANGTPEAIRECCPTSQEDLIALRICALSSYLQSGGKNVQSFLASVPGDQKSAQSLWLLDEVAHSQGPGADESKIPFQPLGPVSTFISELYTLVLAGDQNAIRKYLGLFELAQGTTGDAAEQMEDYLEKLLLGKPALVAENWNIFREHPKALADVNEMMSEDETRQVVSSILKECSAKGRDCREIYSFFK